MTTLVIAITVAAAGAGLYWWRRTSRESPAAGRIERRLEDREMNLKGFEELLKSLHQTEKLPDYPPEGAGSASGSVTFYTIVRGEATKVAAAISEKSVSFKGASRRYEDKDVTVAARAIREMLKARTDCCAFQWGTNSVEYRLHRDQNDEFMFVEITKRPR